MGQTQSNKTTEEHLDKYYPTDYNNFKCPHKTRINLILKHLETHNLLKNYEELRFINNMIINDACNANYETYLFELILLTLKYTENVQQKIISFINEFTLSDVAEIISHMFYRICINYNTGKYDDELGNFQKEGYSDNDIINILTFLHKSFMENRFNCLFINNDHNFHSFKNPQNMLQLAVRYELNISIIENLIKLGVDVNYKDKYGYHFYDYTQCPTYRKKLIKLKDNYISSKSNLESITIDSEE